MAWTTSGCGEVVDGDGRGAGILGHEVAEVVGLAHHDGEVERGDVGAGAVATPAGVDRHHAAAGAEHAEQRADRRRVVAQEDADLEAGPVDERGDRLDGLRELTPRAPPLLVLDRTGRRIDGDDPGDAVRQSSGGIGRHRSLGSGRGGGCSATSAMPIGLPSRV